MNNSPENQTMNRLVLDALTTLQCGSFNDIFEEIVRNEDYFSFKESLKYSLNQLKQVGLLRVTRNSEYILCKGLEKPLPDPNLKRTSRTTKMKSTKSKTAQKKKQTELLGRALRSAGLIEENINNGEYRSSLLSFLTCRADIRAGRAVSSMVQPPIQSKEQYQIEPMETDYAPTTPIACAKTIENQKWNFAPPIPLE